MGGVEGDGMGVQIPLPSDPPTGGGDDPMDGQAETATAANGQAPAQDEQDQRSEAGSDGDPDDRGDASERAAGWKSKWAFWDSVDWTVEVWDDLDIPTDRHIDSRLRPALAAVIEEIVDRIGDEDAIKAERAWKALAYFPSIFFCKDRRGGPASLSVRKRRIKAFWEGDFESLVRVLREDVVRIRERQRKGQERRRRRSTQQRMEDDLVSKWK
uniref:Uncharacterized protein n=1 Tax=Chromera velia CCMP2878 TaxID=1169474 RepID=A0A0G4ICE7_9ALVE|eukprot:Cvel_13127.t1-p1 / transcript=Cvel_13127.t1 / gene=Cvel_13127 / organism=Chromera_velia_CCMP2878 / gene_product=hypothetical protein / transcript_product=hypothetical protein / location=Cvel_scaffold885:21529-22164(-) / protein_length=212 / sequence_SO=supercontig / SO=protein_coding / is_pseudo=false